MSSAGKEERNKKAYSDAKLALQREAQKWKEAFGDGTDGKALALLKYEFYDIPVISNTNPAETQMRAANRDLVRYIMDKLEYTIE